MSKLNDKLFMTNAELQTAIDHLIYFSGTRAADNVAWRWGNHLERLLEIQRERAALMHSTPNEQSDTESIDNAIDALMYHKGNPFLKEGDYYSQLTKDLMTNKSKSVFNKGV